MTTSDFSSYKLPLRVHIESTTFSHPQNFVVTQKQDMERGNPTTIDDPAGAWMNQGIGGDMNTIDLALQLRDAAGVEVNNTESIPLQVRLFYCKGMSSFDTCIVDEVNQATGEDKSGKMTGARSILMVSGKPRSLLHLTATGRGLVSVRILETSSLHERRKFCMEVVPDTDDTRILSLFHKDCGGSYAPAANESAANWTERVKSVSKGVTVMSKINKTGKRDVATQVQQQLAGAAKLLKPKSSEKMDADTLKRLLTQCEQVRSLLFRAAKMKNLKLEGNTTTTTTTATQSNVPKHSTSSPQVTLTSHRSAPSKIGDEADTTLHQPIGLAGHAAKQRVSSMAELEHPSRVSKFHRVSSDQSLFGLKAVGNPQQSNYGLEVPRLSRGVLTPNPDDPQGTHNGAYGEAMGDFSLMLPGPLAGEVKPEVFDVTDDFFTEMFQMLQDDTNDFSIIGCNLSPEGLFFTLDLSQEGWLNEGEVEHALKVLRIPLSSQIAKAFMFACDKDRDGKISKDEFLRYLEEREAQLRKTFDSIDVNNTGYITLEELQIARASNKVRGSDKDLEALITWMDSMDGEEAKNGKVDFEEFKTSLTLLPPSTTLSNVIDLMRKHGNSMTTSTTSH